MKRKTVAGGMVEDAELHHNPGVALSGTQLVQGLGRRKHGASPDNLANIGGDEVADELLHVVVDGPALLHCSHNGGKVVIGQHHLCC